MDKATQLIRWQRITILLLLFAAVITTSAAHEARREENFWRKEVGYSDAEIGDLERRHTRDQRIIQDQNDRLQKYERRFDASRITTQTTSVQ